MTITVPAMSLPWRQQMYLYVPAFVNVTFAAFGRGTLASPL